MKKLENDPWDQPYAYVAPGQHNQDSYDLWTLGADGKEGGKGSDADVNNWE